MPCCIVLAVDPGITGGIAVHGRYGRVTAHKMPMTLRDKLDFFKSWKTVADEANATIRILAEDVGYHRFGNNASASAKFARHCGQLEMAYTAAQIPFELILPQKWMYQLFGTRLPKEKPARKQFIKDFAQRLYPNIKVTLDTSDALALLHFAIWVARPPREEGSQETPPPLPAPE